jgi:hypothetical protein
MLGHVLSKTLLEPPASATHHALRDVLESDPFLESASSTTHHANVALRDNILEPAPSITQDELYWEELLGKLKTQNGFLTACNKALAEQNLDLRSRLEESDKKVNELSPLEERNQHLQNEVASLRNLR